MIAELTFNRGNMIWHSGVTRRAMKVMVAAAALVGSSNAFLTPPTSQSSSTPLSFCRDGDNVIITANNNHHHPTRVSSSLGMIDQSEKVTEYELQVGRALDALKTDYPDMLKRSPDYTIYHPDVEVVDPSGFSLQGIRNYKQAFNLVHGIINVFYCPEKSILTFRMVYDCAHHNIRVSWNSEVVPKAIFGGVKTTLHVDGISVYELDGHGRVVQHRVEHLMINGIPVETEQGIFHALTTSCQQPDCGIPVFFSGADDWFVAKFQTSPSSRESLFSMDESPSSLLLRAFSTSSDMDDGRNEYPDLDWEAFESKNRSRKKFGLEPLTPEQFLEIEEQVKQMQTQQLLNYHGGNDATQVPPPKMKKKNGFLSNIFGQVFEDTCESNFDCQRPEICCDFGFKKMCCSSGSMVGQDLVRQPVRIPITKDDGYYNDY